MKGVSGGLIVAVGLGVLWLAVTGRLTRLAAAWSVLAAPNPNGKTFDWTAPGYPWSPRKQGTSSAPAPTTPGVPIGVFSSGGGIAWPLSLS